MFIKLITPTLITALFLIGCGAESQREASQVNNQAHQVDIKLKTSRALAPEDEEYLNYMKIYNLNSLSFEIEKYNEVWSLNYRGNYDGKKAYYLDTDKNNQTGYYSKWTPKVGAEYLLEEGVLFKYTGTNGTNEWSWDVVSYNGMRDFDHSIESIIAYGITMNDDWSYHGFLGYYDTATPYTEKNARLVRDEGESGKHGAYNIAQDDEEFYIRAINYNYVQKEKAKYYNYEFTINETNYKAENNKLFNSSGEEIATNLSYGIFDKYTIVVIPKTLFASGEFKLEKATIKDVSWNTLNSYRYGENYIYKISREALIGMIKRDEDYSQVDVSFITDMSDLFNRKEVKYDITGWDVSNVTNMSGMFSWTKTFNQPIGDWDVSSVTNMNSMFLFSKSFNQPIEDWNVSNVTSMGGMFGESSSFNQPIVNWDVSNVIHFNYFNLFSKLKEENIPKFNQN